MVKLSLEKPVAGRVSVHSDRLGFNGKKIKKFYVWSGVV